MMPGLIEYFKTNEFTKIRFRNRSEKPNIFKQKKGYL